MSTPIPPPRDFEILPAQPTDLSALARVEAIAFENPNSGPKLVRILFGTDGEEAFQQRSRDFVDMHKSPINKFYKVVTKAEDGTDKVIGMAVWRFTPQPVNERALCAQAGLAPQVSDDPADRLADMVDECESRYMSGKVHACLKGIATLPEYRGRGVASALLLRGILDARARGFKTFWLESTPDAVSLYRRFGFCDVEVLKMDVTVDGKEQTIEFIAMKRTN